jgi:hypothetical protein
MFSEEPRPTAPVPMVLRASDVGRDGVKPEQKMAGGNKPVRFALRLCARFEVVRLLMTVLPTM